MCRGIIYVDYEKDEDTVPNLEKPDKQSNGHTVLTMEKQEEQGPLVYRNGDDEKRIHLEPTLQIEMLNKCDPTSNEEFFRRGRTAVLVIATLLLFSLRSTISMLFLAEPELPGGSLAIKLTNTTGYSVILALVMGLEAFCGEAHGAGRWNLMGFILQITVLALLCIALPIGFLWINMERILHWCGQDQTITKMVGVYINFSLPDLVAQAFLNPLMIYLRTKNIKVPLTWCAAIALLFHIAINFLLVVYLQLGIRGVALANVWTNFIMVFLLVGYFRFSGIYKQSSEGFSKDCISSFPVVFILSAFFCLLLYKIFSVTQRYIYVSHLVCKVILGL